MSQEELAITHTEDDTPIQSSDKHTSTDTLATEGLNSLLSDEFPSILDFVTVFKKHKSVKKEYNEKEKDIDFANAELEAAIKTEQEIASELNLQYRSSIDSCEQCLQIDLHHVANRHKEIKDRLRRIRKYDREHLNSDLPDAERKCVEELGSEEYRRNLRSMRNSLENVIQNKKLQLKELNSVETDKKEALETKQTLEQELSDIKSRIQKCEDELMEKILQQVVGATNNSSSDDLQLPPVESPLRDLVLSTLSDYEKIRVYDKISVYDKFGPGELTMETFSNMVQSANMGIKTERETEAMLIDPFIRTLGWSQYEHSIKRERNIEKRARPDYRLSVQNNSDDVLIIEAKKRGSNLTNHSEQIKRYLKCSPAEWGVLTNGEEFHIYSHSPDNHTPKLKEKLDINDLSDSDRIESLRPDAFI